MKHTFGALTAISSLAFVYKTQNKRQTAHADSHYNLPYFTTGATLNPKFEKRDRDGEDSYAIGADKRMIMVADGVGGWGEVDVDSGIFSRFLSKEIAKIYNEKPE